MPFRAVIVAAGSGERAGEGPPKQWRRVGGQPLVRWSVEAMASAGAAEIIVVTPPGESARAGDALAGLADWRSVDGGASRRDSVAAGLRAVTGEPGDTVLIHDAARPFLRVSHIEVLLAAVGPGRGALPALPLPDTLKAAGADGVRTRSREGLWRAQTPQAFRLGDILSAHEAWNPSETLTDDAQALEHAGGEIVLVPGDPMLMKLTYPEDFAMAERLARAARATRVGIGFDAHRFGPGKGVTLCGVFIEHDHALIGHSDADAGLHALTDALLGAIGAGDIGDHFPPSDARWKDCDSGVFLEHAADLVEKRGGRIVNVDMTLICETPKIKPHREAMRARVAERLDIPLGRVSVKATTTEAMGFTGRREGLAAQAVASVEMPI